MVSPRRLSVVQVLPELESGGVERGTLEVGKHLVEHGHRSIVISAGGRMVKQLLGEGSEHLAWDIGRKRPWTLRLVFRLRRFLRDNRIDILHVRSRMPAWVCYLAWRGMDPATRPHLVTTVHGPYSVNGYSAVMTKGERVIVISELIRDYVLKNYPAASADKLRLIYRGVDPEQFPHGHKVTQFWLAQWARQFPWTLDKRLITLPARITRWKGQEDFIDFMADLHARVPDVHGLIVGDAIPGAGNSWKKSRSASPNAAWAKSSPSPAPQRPKGNHGHLQHRPVAVARARGLRAHHHRSPEPGHPGPGLRPRRRRRTTRHGLPGRRRAFGRLAIRREPRRKVVEFASRSPVRPAVHLGTHAR
jgi:hypothetical protein